MKFLHAMNAGLESKSFSYEVSIIIPVYNGSSLLEKHLTPLLGYLASKPYRTQVILVDDGSLDRNQTAEYARKHNLTFVGLDENKGKGAALRKGFELATGFIQLFTDADIPFQYQNIDTFVCRLSQSPEELLIGDRTDPLSVYFKKTSSLRTMGSNIVVALVDLFFVKDVRDTQCGLKGMGQKVAETLFKKSCINRFAIDVELIYLAYKCSIPIKKLPVQLRYNDRSSVNTVRDGCRLLQDLYRIRKIHGKKKFK
jgi:glycosyltransferase involved in cell wall biosynthesis